MSKPENAVSGPELVEQLAGIKFCQSGTGEMGQEIINQLKADCNIPDVQQPVAAPQVAPAFDISSM